MGTRQVGFGTHLVLRQAALLEHAAGLHVLRLGSAGEVGGARRPGEGITLPPLGTSVHGVGWAKTSVVVRDEGSIALEGMLRKRPYDGRGTYMGVRAVKVEGVFAFDSRVRAEDGVGRLVFFCDGEAQPILRRAVVAIRGLGLRVCADNETGSDEAKERQETKHFDGRVWVEKKRAKTTSAEHRNQVRLYRGDNSPFLSGIHLGISRSHTAGERDFRGDDAERSYVIVL